MMLRYSFNLDKEADAVEKAVEKALVDGIRTGDIMPREGDLSGITKVGTSGMGDAIADRIG